MISTCIRGMSYPEVADNFAAAYPDRSAPSKTTGQRLHEKLITMGCIVNSHIKRVINAFVVTEDIKQFGENATLNLTQLAKITTQSTKAKQVQILEDSTDLCAW